MMRLRIGAPRPVGLAVIALLACVAPAQEAPHQGDLPQPRSFSVPLVDEPHCKAWQEFRSLIAERQWSLAFRAVADDLENPPDGLLPPEDGFSREWKKQVHQDFGALDAEGRRAFELFFGGRARKLVEDARDDRDPGLATAFYAYGLTVAGTRAGDRIAAAALQAGRASEAVEIWEWILKSGATAGYDPRKVRLGLGAAFARLGWTGDFDRVAAALEARWGDDVIDDDGATATVKERVARARAGLASVGPAASVRERLEMPDAPVIAWTWEPPPPAQDEPARHASWIMPGMAGRVPDGGGLEIRVEGATALSSDGKRIRAIDTADGSVIWNRAHHTPGDQALLNAWILPDGDRLFVEEMNETSARSFSCRGSADGVERWMADLQGDGDCLGPPLLDGDDGYVVARGRESQHVTLCAIDLSNGKKRWTLDLGTPISGTGGGTPWLPPEFQMAYIPGVTLLKSGTHVVLMTEGGLALAVDHVRRKVAWAALLEPSAGDGSGRLRVRQEGSIAYATFLGGSELVALDLDRAKVCWRRLIDGGADLAAMDRDRFYLLGDELCAYSRRDRRLLWSRQFWGSVSRIVETRDHLYVMFANSVRELSKDDGDDVRVLRGPQHFFNGSALWAVPTGLVGVGGEGVSLLRTGRPASERATTVPESKESQ